MANGVEFGRPCKLDPHQRREALERIAKGETYTAIARTYAVDPNTISPGPAWFCRQPRPAGRQSDGRQFFRWRVGGEAAGAPA